MGRDHVAVKSSDGSVYKSMASAARAAGVPYSSMANSLLKRGQYAANGKVYTRLEYANKHEQQQAALPDWLPRYASGEPIEIGDHIMHEGRMLHVYGFNVNQEGTTIKATDGVGSREIVPNGAAHRMADARSYTQNAYDVAMMAATSGRHISADDMMQVCKLLEMALAASDKENGER